MNSTSPFTCKLPISYGLFLASVAAGLQSGGVYIGAVHNCFLRWLKNACPNSSRLTEFPSLSRCVERFSEKECDSKFPYKQPIRSTFSVLKKMLAFRGAELANKNRVRWNDKRGPGSMMLGEKVITRVRTMR